MKLRISKNAIRCRIQQNELRMLHEKGRVIEKLSLGSLDHQTFSYALTASTLIDAVDVEYEDGLVNILVPAELVNEMVETDRVGISGEKHFNNQPPLSILIEKDFKCLSHREEDADAFPHPDEDTASC